MPPSDERALCIAFSIDHWDRLSTVERIRTRGELLEKLERVCGEQMTSEYCSGERLAVVLRGDPTAVLPEMIHSMAERGGFERLRMTAARGIGGASCAVAEAMWTLRDVDPPQDVPARVALGESLYRELARRSGPGRRPPVFRRTAGRRFGPRMWMWPCPPGVRGEHLRPGAVPAFLLGWEARRRMRSGRHAEALGLLRRALRLSPSSLALASLGLCLRELGRHREAAGVWHYLIRHRPLDARAYLLAGDCAERESVARAYLREGLQVVYAHSSATAERQAVLRELLLALARLSYRREAGAEGDRLVNEAARADPASPEPLRELAAEAERRGDVRMAQLLLQAALARAPETAHTFQTNYQRQDE